MNKSAGAFRTISEVAEELGVPKHVLRFWEIKWTPRKGNLVARYRGRGEGEGAVLLLAHLDVVEADPADWSVPPFRLIEQDGYYYGRGTLDD